MPHLVGEHFPVPVGDPFLIIIWNIGTSPKRPGLRGPEVDKLTIGRRRLPLCDWCVFLTAHSGGQPHRLCRQSSASNSP